MAGIKGVKTTMECFGEVALGETVYKLAREGKIHAVKIEFGKDNRIIIRGSYDWYGGKKELFRKNLFDNLLAQEVKHD